MTLPFVKYFKWGGPTNFESSITIGTKLHTIRPDIKGRWREGIAAQMVTGNRTKHRNQFYEAQCKGTQGIVIVFDNRGKIDTLAVDGNRVSNYEVIAKNDGLNLLDFEKFFYGASYADVYKGVIIHFTNLKY